MYTTMNWLSALGLAVLLLSIQYDSVDSASYNLSISPWAEQSTARSFMNCLIRKITSSDVLPMQEKEDLKSIMDTLMSAVNEANARGHSSGAQLKAINMAIASSLAEIVVAEDVGNQASIAVKTQALSGALEQCFQTVLGTIDRKFINEINDLISMFAKEAASEEATQNQQGFAALSDINGVQKQRGFSGDSSSSFQTTSQTADNTYQSSETFQGSAKSTSGYGRGYSGLQASQPVQMRVRPQISQPGRIGLRRQVSKTVPASQTKSSSSTIFSQTAASSTNGAISTTGRYPVGSEAVTLGTTVAQSGDSLVGGGSQARLISRMANALANSPNLKAVLRRGVPQKTAYNLIRRTVQSLADTLGVDKNNLGRKALKAISRLSPGSDTYAYAQALSTALVTSGILNESNIESVGPKVLSAVFNGLSNARQGHGIHVDNGNVQNDLPSINGFQTTSAVSTSLTQPDSSNGASSKTDGYSGGYTIGTLRGQVAQTVDSSVRGSQQNGIISRLTNALVNSPKFGMLLKRGVDQQTASNLIQRIVQSLANTLSIDGDNLGSLALQSISQLSPRADTADYAQVLSNALVSSGILNERNIDSRGPQILVAILSRLSRAGQGLDINVETGNVQTAIQSSSDFRTSSLSNNLSQSDSSTIDGTSSTIGGYSGGYPAGTLGGPVAPIVDSSVRGSQQYGIISRLTDALVNSPKFRAALRRGVSPQTASNLIQRIVQSLANTLGFDGNNLGSLALQSISKLSTRSETADYAQVLSNALVSSGILNERNIDSKGPLILTAILSGLSSAGQGIDINVETNNVQNTIQSSNDFRTSSLSNSLSQSESSTINGGSSRTGSYSGGYPAGPLGGLVAPTVESSVKGSQKNGITSRLTNALVNSPTFRAALRRGVSPQTSSDLVQRIVQSLSNTLGFDGNNLGSLALQSISQLSPHSNTAAYAQALSTALVSSGILNARNIDSKGPQILEAVLSGLSSAGQGLDINVDTGNVQNAMQLSSNFRTSSSSNSLSQSESSTINGASSTTEDYSGGYPAGTLGGLVAPTVESSVKGSQKNVIISRLTNALVNLPKFRATLRKGVSPQTASILIQRIVQSLSNTLGIDGNNLGSSALQSISQLSPHSDTDAYAQALSTALVYSGILNARNIDSKGPHILAAVLSGLSSEGQDLDVNVETGNVQNVIQSSSDFHTSSSSNSLSQSDSSTINSASPTTEDYSGGYSAGTFSGPVVSTVDFSVRGSQQNGIISRLTNALVNSPKYRAVLRRGVSLQTASNLIQRILQSLANTLGLDGNNLGSLALQSISQLSPDSDTAAYAQVLSTAIVSSGILNERNIDFKGPQILSRILNGLSSAGHGLDINVDTGNAQSAIQSRSGYQTTSSSSTSFSQADDSTTSGVTKTIVDYIGGPGTPNVDSPVRGGSQSGLITRVTNALVNSPTFRTHLRRGVSSQTASNLIQTTIQSLANTFGVDGNNLGKIALQTISQLSPRSDTTAYAQVLSTVLVNGGILNESNIDSVGPQVLTVVSNGLSSTGQGLGNNVGNNNEQNDIQSSGGFQTTSSSSTSFSQPDGFSTSGVTSTTGDYSRGISGGHVAPTVDSPVRGESQTGLISRVTNALVNSPTFRTHLRRGVSLKTASNLIQTTIQSLANTFGVDGNNLGRIALQAISQLPPRSDSPGYAQVLSTVLVTGGILNESNIDSVGPQVLSAVLNELSSTGQGLGHIVGNNNEQNDIQSSGGFQTTSSSSTSFSQSDGSSTSGVTSTTGDYSRGSSGGYIAPTVDSLVRGESQARLISRVRNALVNSSAFRALLRRGVSSEIASNLIQRTIQSLANTLGVDGNNLQRIALQAISQLSPLSDSPGYAQVLSTVLVNGGILNESNIDSAGPQVLSAVLNGLLSTGQGLGINVDYGIIENDRVSINNFIKKSSTTSVSEKDDETSTVGLTRDKDAGSLVDDQQFDSYSDETSSGQSSINQSNFSQSGGFVSSVTNQGVFSETSGTAASGLGLLPEVDVLPSLNSPNGLKSGSAATRISQLASSILNSISPVGVDANLLARILQASVSNLRSSGMSSRDAKIEVLLETIVGLLQLLSNAQVRELNMTTASAVTSSAARSFELALA